MAGPIRISILADGKQATREIGQVDSKLGKMAKGGLKLAGAGFLALGAGAVAAGVGLLGLAKGAAEDDKAQKVLARTLKNTTKATDAQVASVEDYISKTGVATGVTDDEMRPAFATLARSTKDLTKTTKLMNLALDISAGTGKDLSAVTAALAKGALGSTGALAKLGVQTKDSSGKALKFDDIVKNLNKTFGGQSAAAAGTLEGKWARLKLIAAEAGETIGGKLLPKLTDFADFVLTKVVPAAGKFGTFLETEVAPKIKTFASDAIPKIKTALDNVKTVWDENKGKVKDLADNIATLSTNVTTKLVPAVESAMPTLQTLARIDLTNTTNAVKAINILLSKGDGTANGPNGVLAKLQSLGTIANALNPAAKLAAIAQQAVTAFGDVFVKDATLRAKVAGWIGRNFVGLAGLLPVGQLAAVGALGANTIARAFGIQNPAAAVASFMVKLGRYAIIYNPVALYQSASRRLGDAISRGLLDSQPTVAGRAAALAKRVGTAFVSALPFGSVFTQGSRLGGKAMDGVRAGISSGISGVIGVVRSIPGRLAANAGNWGSALIGAGASLIHGLVSGIEGALPSLHGVLSKVTGLIPSWKGPADKDAKLLVKSGQLIMGGLLDGITGELPKLETLLGKVSTGIETGLSSKPTVDLTAVPLTSSAAAATIDQRPIVIQVYALTAGPEVGRATVDAIKQYEQFNGNGWRN